MFLVLIAGAVGAEEVSVFDWQVGRHYNYSVGGIGNYGWIYDYQTRSFSDVLQTPYGSTTYHHDTGGIYDLHRTSPRSYTGYDYNTRTMQDYNFNSWGGVSVYDYGTGGFYDYSRSGW
jgi:hypothetical protein